MGGFPRLILVLLLALPLRAFAAGDAGGGITQLLQLPIPDELTFCGEPVPLQRPEVAERLDLELVVTLGSPVRTSLWLKRIPRYFPMIEEQLRRRGLPEDLKYVALVESNLRADARSYAGAVGPWQFVGSTGREMGLAQRSWVDQRRDWEEATAAALEYLQALHESFGSWPLAMAAYNAGRKRVATALEEQQEAGFYALRLPRETERYVFRALAAKLVVEDPQAYGIQLEGARTYPPLANRALEVEVTRRKLPLAALAHAAGVPYRQLLQLNPWMVGSWLPRGTHRIQVPEQNVEGFGEGLVRWEEQNPEPQRVYYQVRRGDTLSAIARRHQVGLGELLAWNGLHSRSVIHPGQEIVIQTVD